MTNALDILKKMFEEGNWDFKGVIHPKAGGEKIERKRYNSNKLG